MILATEPPLGENLAKLESRCKMFHVEHPDSMKINAFSLGRYFGRSLAWRDLVFSDQLCSTWNNRALHISAKMFHVEHSSHLPDPDDLENLFKVNYAILPSLPLRRSSHLSTLSSVSPGTV